MLLSVMRWPGRAAPAIMQALMLFLCVGLSHTGPWAFPGTANTHAQHSRVPRSQHRSGAHTPPISTSEPYDCSKHSQLYAQVYNDLMPWQASGISQKLIKQSIYEGYLKRLDPLRYSGAPLAIIDGRVYLTHGPLEKDTNDFILGKLHDLQDTVSTMGPVPDVELMLHTGDFARSVTQNVFREPPWDKDQVPLVMFGYCKRSTEAFEILIPSGHFWQHRVDEMFEEEWQQKSRVPWARKKDVVFGRYTATSGTAISDLYGRALPTNVREHLMGLSRRANASRAEAAAAGEGEAAGAERGAGAGVPHLDVWTLNTYDTNRKVPGVSPATLEQHGTYKYVVSMDGYACSTRLEKLLALGSTVLKQESTHYSFYYQALRPFRHYMPFYRTGPNDVLDAVQWLRAHPREAQAIAVRGQRFARAHLHKQARMCYWRTLLHEYAKLLRFQPSLADYPNATLLEDDPLMQARPLTLMARTNIFHAAGGK